MKDRKNENLRRLARKVADLEMQVKDPDIGSKEKADYEKRISNILGSLEPDELFFIDDYIFKKKLIK